MYDNSDYDNDSDVPSNTLDSDLIEALGWLREDPPSNLAFTYAAHALTHIDNRLDRDEVYRNLNKAISALSPQPSKKELEDRERARKKRKALWSGLRHSEGFQAVKADLENIRCRTLCRDDVLTHLLLLYWADKEQNTTTTTTKKRK